MMTRQLGTFPRVLLVAAALSGCGLDASNDVQRVDSNLLRQVNAAPTSTTTTTEPPPPTEPPETAATVPPGSTTTATSELPTTATMAPFRLYFIGGSRLVPVPVDLPVDPSPRARLDALEAGPPADFADEGVRTAVPLDLVRSWRRGTPATVDLDGELYDTIEPEDQRFAIGQIVLTLTQDPETSAVRFTVDGEGLRVFRHDESVSDPGEAVGWSDYAALLEGADRAPADDT